MDTVELTSGTSKAVISRDGAWLTNLSDNRGDILFPKQQIVAGDGNKRARGGSHVCLPNFGPGGASGLVQHGFGRVSSWKVVEQGKTSVALELEGGPQNYSNLLSRLTYTLTEHSLSISLRLTNKGGEVLRVAPGFHPYFALSYGEEQVAIDGEAYELADLSGTIYLEGDRKTVVTKTRHISLSSENLPVWAVWTDRLGSYVCVEPTYDGYAFMEQTAPEGELLRAGLSETYRMTIAW